MNYCPSCGTKVESFWNVCSNCGYRLSEERISTIVQKQPEMQIEPLRAEIPPPVKIVASKPSNGYFETEKTYGTVALVAGIIGLGLTFLIIFLRIIGISTSSLIIFNNLMIIILCILAIVSGILGIVKDDSKAMGIIGLILGVAGLIGLYIRVIFFILRVYIPFPFFD